MRKTELNYIFVLLETPYSNQNLENLTRLLHAFAAGVGSVGGPAGAGAGARAGVGDGGEGDVKQQGEARSRGNTDGFHGAERRTTRRSSGDSLRKKPLPKFPMTNFSNCLTLNQIQWQ